MFMDLREINLKLREMYFELRGINIELREVNFNAVNKWTLSAIVIFYLVFSFNTNSNTLPLKTYDDSNYGTCY